MRLFLFLLVMVVSGSAFSLVVSQYEARELFIRLERGKTEQRELDSAFRQLQLDQTASAKHSLIDDVARNQLHMQVIVPERTLYLRAQSDGKNSVVLAPIEKEKVPE